MKISKRAYSGAVCNLVYCERCGARLDIRKTVWLAMDTRTGTYTDREIPEKDNQGAFAFGAACAKQALAEDADARKIVQ